MNSVKNSSILEIDHEKRTKCLVYTRVMGYHRPVESFNKGKKGEHKQRTYFRQQLVQEINL
jgi:Anaerobic ribonucleoside-triphosphate reductase